MWPSHKCEEILIYFILLLCLKAQFLFSAVWLAMVVYSFLDYVPKRVPTKPFSTHSTIYDRGGDYPTPESAGRKSFRHQVHNKYVKKIYYG